MLAAKHDDARLNKELNITVHLPNVGALFLSTLFRVIKGKRVACLGKTSTQNVFVKIYFDSLRAGIHYKRSLKGTLAFLNNSILTPRIIFSGFCPEYNFYVIIQKFVFDAKTMGQIFWDAEKDLTRHELIDTLMVCLARHHKQGVIQKDLQMGNFLIKDDKIFSLDGDQVKEKKRSVNRKEAIVNLAAFYYNFPIEYLDYLPKFFDTYCRHRNWIRSDNDIIALKNNINKRRKYYVKSFLKKIFKSKDPFKVKKSQHSFVVRDLRKWHDKYTDIIEDPFQFFSETEKEGISEQGCFNFEIESTMLQISFGKINPLARLFKKDHFSRQWHQSIRHNLFQGDISKSPIALVHIKKHGKWFGVIVEEKTAD